MNLGTHAVHKSHPHFGNRGVEDKKLSTTFGLMFLCYRDPQRPSYSTNGMIVFSHFDQWEARICQDAGDKLQSPRATCHPQSWPMSIFPLLLRHGNLSQNNFPFSATINKIRTPIEFRMGIRINIKWLGKSQPAIDIFPFFSSVTFIYEILAPTIYSFQINCWLRPSGKWCESWGDSINIFYKHKTILTRPKIMAKDPRDSRHYSS